MRRFSFMSVLLFISSYQMASAADGSAQAKFALLIGIDKYKNLSDGEQLDGCRNDVGIMKQLLIDRFDFTESQIGILLDEQATGNAIRQRMAKLVEHVRAVPKDQQPVYVVFHYSGHGSQVVDQAEGDPDCDEEDGFDETLVPHDAKKQGGKEDIRDDELYRFVESLSKDGRAKVWLVQDCCHSGTGARGATKTRKLRRALAPPPRGDGPRRVVQKQLPQGTLVLSACRAVEQEPEYHDPSTDKPHGLLTYFLAQALNDQRLVSSMSYALLRDTVIARYRENRQFSTTPQIEGSSEMMQSVVLGGGIDRKPYWEVVPGEKRGQMVLKAGAFHGITVGSEYELYERPEQTAVEHDDPENRSLALMRIESVDGVTAKATTFRRANGEVNEFRISSKIEKAYAIERHHEGRGFGIQLRIVRAIDENSDSSPLRPGDDIPKAIRDALESANRADESPWLHWMRDASACDLLLRIDGDYAALFAATGNGSVPDRLVATRGETPKSLVGGWGPFDLRTSTQATQDLQKALRQVARAWNLIRIATTQRDSGNSNIRIKLELDAIKVEDKEEITDRRPWTPMPIDEGQLIVRDDEYYDFRVVNLEKTGKPVYLTVLEVDADMGISQIHPFQEAGQLYGEQQVAPGSQLEVGGFACCREGEALPPEYGQRWVIALATREPNTFYTLAQPSLLKARGGRGGTAGSLDDLLTEQTYFKTRGRRLGRKPKKLYDDSWGAAILIWTAAPRE